MSTRSKIFNLLDQYGGLIPNLSQIVLSYLGQEYLMYGLLLPMVGIKAQPSYIQILEANTGKEVLSLDRGRNPVDFQVVNPNGDRLYFQAGKYYNIEVFDIPNRKTVATLVGHQASLSALAISRDGTRLYSGSNDHTIKIWNTVTGKVINTLSTDYATQILIISPDQTKLYSVDYDRRIKVWNGLTGEIITSFKPNPFNIKSLVINQNGTKLYSLDYSYHPEILNIKVWDTSTGESINLLTSDRVNVNCLAIGRDGTKLYYGCNNKTIKVWNTSTGKVINILRSQIEPINLAINSDGSKLYLGSFGIIEVWDILTEKYIGSIELKGNQTKLRLFVGN